MLRISLYLILLLSPVVMIAAPTPDNMAELPSAVSSLNYHLRLAPHKNRAVKCVMYWDYVDATDYKAFEYVVPALLDNDARLGFECKYRVVVRTNGADSVYSEGRFSSSYPTGLNVGLSVILKANADGASISAGGDNSKFLLDVPFRYFNPGKVGYESEQALKELRNDVRIKSIPAPEYAPFDDLDELKAYLTASADPLECFWDFLDRNTNPEKSHIGGRYQLATVARGDGAYSLVYVGGAVNGAEHWQPLRIKAYLTPTIFHNHFNLVWLDTAGNAIESETSATVDINNTILKLDFPLYEASIRFSRAEMK
ncbi:MAG: hypothetical protein J1F05_00595 [Muribaculaceae bacterium]|nr:hypothetical protein [Muribaculaceae bacterium]